MWGLDLDQVKIVHHALILTDSAVRRVGVRDRRGFHFRYDGRRIVRVAVLHRLHIGRGDAAWICEGIALRRA